MVPESCFRNNMTAAQAIREYIAGVGPEKLWLKPYNRYLPETTEWWFIPGTDWPAYHHGKLFLWRAPMYSSKPGLLYAGYYVEHGLGKEVGDLPGVNKKLIMTQQWYWQEFLKQSKDGALDRTARLISQKSKCTVTIFLKTYEFKRVHEPDKEPGIPFDALEFSLEPGKDNINTTLQGRKILKPLNISRNIAELGDLLEKTKDFAFFWIDVMIGIQLTYGNNEQNDGWNAKEIWDNALKPWLSFAH